MENALDVELQDDQLVDEIRLVTELMVVATMASGELEQDVIDEALGLPPLRGLPRQRPGERAAARPPSGPA